MIPLLLFCFVAAAAQGGEFPRTVEAFRGSTPKLDGVISPGEWDDAVTFAGVKDWIPQFSRTTDPKDLSLRGWVKHDGKRLYFAFDITDDVLYGIDTPRWIPEENPKVHELSREGFPWFGDEMELLINASNKWTANEGAAGNGSSWQMVCNLTKSRKGGVGVGGLLEGEPRRSEAAWNTYQKWILSGAQEAAAKPKPGGKGYIIEWAVNFDPCLEVEPGRFYSTAMGDRAMGLNIALGDLDQKEAGAGNFGHFHHEDWLAGAKDVRTQNQELGNIMDPNIAETGGEARPRLTTYEGIAKMIDHSLLRPELTEEQIAEGCRVARDYNVASVTVRPCDVDFAVRQMEGSGVPVGSVSGFPHGSMTTAAKLYETRDLLRRGAKEVDMVLNIGKLLSRQFQFVDLEIQQMAQACHEQGAILKVIFENAYLTDDLKIIACRICGRAGADFVKTSTGFAPTGATIEDLKLMRAHSNPDVRVKAAGGVRTLDKALEVYNVGCDRFGATATIAILEDWKARLAAEAKQNAAQS